MKNLKYFFLLFLLAIVFVHVNGASAGEHYVRAGATGAGNGSNWTNAYANLPATLVRGDTYYVAAGVYGGYSFDDPETADSKFITIKRATASDHGAATDWNPAYGQGVAEFRGAGLNTFYFATGHWIFDGQVGGGPGSWTSGHGFLITTTAATSDTKLVNIAAGTSDITLAHVEMRQCGEDTGTYKQDCLYAVGINSNGTPNPINNLTVRYSYLHDVNRTLILTRYCVNTVFEYNELAHRYTSGTAPHGEAISIGGGLNSNYHIRWNRFHDVYGTCFISIMDFVQGGHYIYGNVFWQGSDPKYITTNGAIGNTGGDTNHDEYIYFNTFYNLDGSTINGGVGFFNAAGNNINVYNNIFYNVKCQISAGINHDYNWFYNSGSQSEAHIQQGESGVFYDAANLDFRLKKDTNPGITWSASGSQDINTDLFRRVRSSASGGPVSRGAFIFFSAPQNLRFQ